MDSILKEWTVDLPDYGVWDYDLLAEVVLDARGHPGIFDPFRSYVDPPCGDEGHIEDVWFEREGERHPIPEGGFRDAVIEALVSDPDFLDDALMAMRDAA